MGNKRFDAVLSGPGFALGTWTCTCDHRAPGAEQWSAYAVVNVVLEGAFVRHVGRRALLADPTVALVSPAGESWRSSHPAHVCGDHGVWVGLADADRARERLRPLSAATWLDWGRVARDGDVELAAALLDDVLGGDALPAREPWYVTRARRALAERVREPPDLGALSAELRVSPWHLCRTFRAFTGVTPRAYAERLRLAAAARRVADGERDLGSLAHELGFSSHSHLSARWRAVYGGSPSAWRARAPARS